MQLRAKQGAAVYRHQAVISVDPELTWLRFTPRGSLWYYEHEDRNHESWGRAGRQPARLRCVIQMQHFN